jgi:serine O-acetyltransferase
MHGSSIEKANRRAMNARHFPCDAIAKAQNGICGGVRQDHNFPGGSRGRQPLSSLAAMELRDLLKTLKRECTLYMDSPIAGASPVRRDSQSTKRRDSQGTNVSRSKIGLSAIFKSYLFDNGFRLLFLYRLSRYFFLRFKDTRILWNIPQVIVQHMLKVTSSLISPKAQIGEGCRIYYGTGIIIGSHAIIGRNAKILNGITIGNTHPSAGKQVVVIGDNVFIGTGAKILGNINIGDNVKIGANAVVLKSCGSDVTLVGMPARVVSKK